ncbi:terpene synthase family protein [Actinomycetes bacterium KLBMP 9797]
MRSDVEIGARPEAVESGRICAVAGQAQREMRAWAAAYPALFSAKAFDAALYSTLALATAFSGPWLDAGHQRMANRVALWCFGLDWLVDYVATTPDEARDVARRCLTAADGGPAANGDELALFLADIRAELAAAPGYAELGPVWRDELRRMLWAMVRECEWKAAAGRRPTFDEYLANADNLGFSFVFAAHWIFTEDGGGDVAAVRAASWATQRVIRLLNDLATYDRDVSWGDLNALMLGVTREQVRERVAALAAEARALIQPVRVSQPRLADYLERQMEFCVGFYGVTDYWGSL